MNHSELEDLLGQLILQSSIYNGQTISSKRIEDYAIAVSQQLMSNYDKKFLFTEFIVQVMDNGKKEFYGESNPFPKNILNWFQKEITKRNDIEHAQIKEDSLNVDVNTSIKFAIELQCLSFAKSGWMREVDYTRALNMSLGEEYDSFMSKQWKLLIAAFNRDGDILEYLRYIRKEIINI